MKNNVGILAGCIRMKFTVKLPPRNFPHQTKTTVRLPVTKNVIFFIAPGAFQHRSGHPLSGGFLLLVFLGG